MSNLIEHTRYRTNENSFVQINAVNKFFNCILFFFFHEKYFCFSDVIPFEAIINYDYSNIEWDMGDGHKFYGLKNFIDAFKDETMWEAFKNTMQN